MQNLFATTLRELRRKNGNTQEDLANHLGISVQAVSKWERAEGLPDITYLPSIAAFYSTSIDTLLGCDKAAKEARFHEICKEYDRIRQTTPREDGTLIVENNLEAGIEHIRAALVQFPDSWFFMQLLASDLWYYSKLCEGDKRIQILDEAEKWCRKLLNKSPGDCPWRHCANEILCLVLYEEGNKQQSIDLARSLPDAIGSNDFMLTNVLEGIELERQLNISIREFIRLAYMCVNKLHENNFSKTRLREQEFIKFQLDTIINIIYND